MIKTLLFLTLFSCFGWAGENALRVEGFYGYGLANPTELNSLHDNMTWFGIPIADHGSFGKPALYGVSAGKNIGMGFLAFRYDRMYESLGVTPVNESDFRGQSVSFTLHEFFKAETIYIMLDIPKHLGSFSELTYGVGIGYAFRFEYHQKTDACKYCLFPCEDIIWQAHPIAYRARVSWGFNFTPHFAVFAEGILEYFKAPELKAAAYYPRDFDGGEIAEGTVLTGQVERSKPIVVDYTGIRAAAGVRLNF